MRIENVGVCGVGDREWENVLLLIVGHRLYNGLYILSTRTVYPISVSNGCHAGTQTTHHGKCQDWRDDVRYLNS